METREKMMQYMDTSTIVGKAVAELVGVSYHSIWMYMKNPEKHVFVGTLVEKFLAGDGQALTDIQHALRNGAQNRAELHRRRAEILKKAKVHPTTNQRVPSLSYS